MAWSDNAYDAWGAARERRQFEEDTRRMGVVAARKAREERLAPQEAPEIDPSSPEGRGMALIDEARSRQKAAAQMAQSLAQPQQQQQQDAFAQQQPQRPQLTRLWESDQSRASEEGYAPRRGVWLHDGGAKDHSGGYGAVANEAGNRSDAYYDWLAANGGVQNDDDVNRFSDQYILERDYLGVDQDHANGRMRFKDDDDYYQFVNNAMQDIRRRRAENSPWIARKQWGEDIADRAKSDLEYLSRTPEALDKTALKGMDSATIMGILSDQNADIGAREFVYGEVQKAKKDALHERGLGWDVVAGMIRGGHQIKTGVGNIWNTAVEGDGGFEDWKSDMAWNERQQDWDDAWAPRYMTSFRDAKGGMDYVRYAAETVSEQVPRMAAATAAAYATGGLSTALGASASTALAVARGTNVAANMIYNIGEAYTDQLDEGVRENHVLALAQGALYGAIDAYTDQAFKLTGNALRRTFGGTVTENTARALKKEWTASTGDAVKKWLIGAANEGFGEALQSQGVGRLRRAIQTGSFYKDGETHSEAFNEALEEFMGGAVAGLLFGGFSARSGRIESQNREANAHNFNSIVNGGNGNPAGGKTIDALRGWDSIACSEALQLRQHELEALNSASINERGGGNVAKKSETDRAKDAKAARESAEKMRENAEAYELSMSDEGRAAYRAFRAITYKSNLTEEELKATGASFNRAAQMVKRRLDGHPVEEWHDEKTGVVVTHFTDTDEWKVNNAKGVGLCAPEGLSLTFHGADMQERAFNAADTLAQSNVARAANIRLRAETTKAIANKLKQQYGHKLPRIVFYDHANGLTDLGDIEAEAQEEIRRVFDARRAALDDSFGANRPLSGGRNVIFINADKCNSPAALAITLMHEDFHSTFAAMAHQTVETTELKNLLPPNADDAQRTKVERLARAVLLGQATPKQIVDMDEAARDKLIAPFGEHDLTNPEERLARVRERMEVEGKSTSLFGSALRGLVKILTGREMSRRDETRAVLSFVNAAKGADMGTLGTDQMVFDSFGSPDLGAGGATEAWGDFCRAFGNKAAVLGNREAFDRLQTLRTRHDVLAALRVAKGNMALAHAILMRVVMDEGGDPSAKGVSKAGEIGNAAESRHRVTKAITGLLRLMGTDDESRRRLIASLQNDTGNLADEIERYIKESASKPAEPTAPADTKKADTEPAAPTAPTEPAAKPEKKVKPPRTPREARRRMANEARLRESLASLTSGEPLTDAREEKLVRSHLRQSAERLMGLGWTRDQILALGVTEEMLTPPPPTTRRERRDILSRNTITAEEYDLLVASDPSRADDYRPLEDGNYRRLTAEERRNMERGPQPIPDWMIDERREAADAEEEARLNAMADEWAEAHGKVWNEEAGTYVDKETEAPQSPESGEAPAPTATTQPVETTTREEPGEGQNTLTEAERDALRDNGQEEEEEFPDEDMTTEETPQPTQEPSPAPAEQEAPAPQENGEFLSGKAYWTASPEMRQRVVDDVVRIAKRNLPYDVPKGVADAASKALRALVAANGRYEGMSEADRKLADNVIDKTLYATLREYVVDSVVEAIEEEQGVLDREQLNYDDLRLDFVDNDIDKPVYAEDRQKVYDAVLRTILESAGGTLEQTQDSSDASARMARGEDVTLAEANAMAETAGMKVAAFMQDRGYRRKRQGGWEKKPAPKQKSQKNTGVGKAKPTTAAEAISRKQDNPETMLRIAENGVWKGPNGEIAVAGITKGGRKRLYKFAADGTDLTQKKPIYMDTQKVEKQRGASTEMNRRLADAIKGLDKVTDPEQQRALGVNAEAGFKLDSKEADAAIAQGERRGEENKKKAIAEEKRKQKRSEQKARKSFSDMWDDYVAKDGPAPDADPYAFDLPVPDYSIDEKDGGANASERAAIDAVGIALGDGVFADRLVDILSKGNGDQATRLRAKIKGPSAEEAERRLAEIDETLDKIRDNIKEAFEKAESEGRKPDRLQLQQIRILLEGDGTKENRGLYWERKKAFDNLRMATSEALPRVQGESLAKYAARLSKDPRVKALRSAFLDGDKGRRANLMPRRMAEALYDVRPEAFSMLAQGDTDADRKRNAVDAIAAAINGIEDARPAPATREVRVKEGAAMAAGGVVQADDAGMHEIKDDSEIGQDFNPEEGQDVVAEEDLAAGDEADDRRDEADEYEEDDDGEGFVSIGGEYHSPEGFSDEQAKAAENDEENWVSNKLATIYDFEDANDRAMQRNLFIARRMKESGRYTPQQIEAYTMWREDPDTGGWTAWMPEDSDSAESKAEAARRRFLTPGYLQTMADVVPLIAPVMQETGERDVYGKTAGWKKLGLGKPNSGERRLYGSYVDAIRGLGPAGAAASAVARIAAAEPGRIEASGDTGQVRQNGRQSSAIVRQRQERAVELWAKGAKCWYGDDAAEFFRSKLPFEGNGSRSDVFLDKARNRVIKLSKINYADLGTGIDMMALFNLAADDRNRYSILGFGRRESEEAALYRELGMPAPKGMKGDFCAIISQPYMAESDIDFDATAKLTARDILNHLNGRLAKYGITLAPEHAGSYAFANDNIVVSDAIPGNVVVTKDGYTENDGGKGGINVVVSRNGGIVVLDADFELKAGVFKRFHSPDVAMRALADAEKRATGHDVMLKDASIEPEDEVNNDLQFKIIGAKGADRLGMRGRDDAERMEKAGVGRREIWQKTGWWRGKDGKWWIDGPDARLKPDVIEEFVKENIAYREVADKAGEKVWDDAWQTDHPAPAPLRLEDVLVDDKNARSLFDAYPQLRNIPVVYSPWKTALAAGRIEVDERGYNIVPKAIVVGPDFIDDKIKVHQERVNKRVRGLERSYNADGLISHEIQHLIQAIERSVEPAYPGIRSDRMVYGETGEYVEDPLGENASDTDRVRHMFTPLEYDAHVAQIRSEMTPEERAATPPWEMLDVNESSGITLKSADVVDDAARESRRNVMAIPEHFWTRAGIEHDEDLKQRALDKIKSDANAVMRVRDKALKPNASLSTEEFAVLAYGANLSWERWNDLQDMAAHAPTAAEEQQLRQQIDLEAATYSRLDEAIEHVKKDAGRLLRLFRVAFENDWSEPGAERKFMRATGIDLETADPALKEEVLSLASQIREAQRAIVNEQRRIDGAPQLGAQTETGTFGALRGTTADATLQRVSSRLRSLSTTADREAFLAPHRQAIYDFRAEDATDDAKMRALALAAAVGAAERNSTNAMADAMDTVNFVLDSLGAGSVDEARMGELLKAGPGDYGVSGTEIADGWTPSEAAKNDRGVIEMQNRLRRLTDRFDALCTRQRLAKLKRTNPTRWAFEKTGGLFQAFRTTLTSYDLSAFLRQGALYVAAHPIEGIKALRKSVRALHETDAAILWNNLGTDEEKRIWKDAGLALEDPNDRKASSDDRGRQPGYSKFLDWVGENLGVDASERAYKTALNYMRTGMFTHLARNLQKANGGEDLTTDQLHDIARAVNIATGSGVTPANSGKGLNMILWAPKLMASRIEYLTQFDLMSVRDKNARKAIAAEKARALMGMALVIALARALTKGDDDDDDEGGFADPSGTNWAAVKVGDTHIDLTGGLAGYIRLASRELRGVKYNTKGERVEMKARDKWEEAARFMRTKFNPMLSLATDLIVGENVIGEPMSKPKALLLGTMVPLSFQDIGESFRDNESAEAGLIGSLLAFLGAGVSTYATGSQKLMKRVDAWKDYVRAEGEAGDSAQFRADANRDFPGIFEKDVEWTTPTGKTRKVSRYEYAARTYDAAWKANRDKPTKGNRKALAEAEREAREVFGVPARS